MELSENSDSGSDMEPLRQRNPEEDSSSECDNDDNARYDDEDRPLQLAQLTKTSDYKESFQLEVNHSVLNKVIQSCEGRPVSVISTIGHCKSGKSLMMNHIVQKLKSPGVAKTKWLSGLKRVKGFPYKSGYHPTTQGIWVWHEALFVKSDEDEEIAVIVMDTQGFSEEFTTVQEILLLTGISVLSSSLLIVNLFGDFPEAALEWLSPMMRCGSQCLEKGVKEPFQRISYLIRDWSRVQQYGPWGDKGGAKLLNKLREKVKSSGRKLSPVFEDMNCFLLPHVGEKALRNSTSGNSDALCPEFASRYAKYINGQLEPDNLPVKKVLGNDLDPNSFKAFFLAYVQMFNEVLAGDDLETNLSPQVFWETTLNVAENLKTERGLAEYRSVFRQRTKASEVLRTSGINTLHVSAQKKCLQAFRKFKIPTSEETEMEKKMRDLVSVEREGLISSNRSSWKRQVERKLEEGQRQTRVHTEKRFPFLFGTNSKLIFYEDTELANFYENMVVCWVDDAVDELECENEEEMEEVKAEYKKILLQRGQEFKKRNADIRGAAVENMSEVISNLTREYCSAIDDMMKVLPNMDEATLQALHDKEIKTVERKCREVPVGTPEYREEWVVKLKEGTEREVERRKVNLESTMTSALERVSEMGKRYRKELEKTAVEKKMDDDDIKRYHDKQVGSLLAEFKQSNPFPSESSKSTAMEGKLKNILNKVCIDVLREGKQKKARLEELYSQTVTTVLHDMKRKLETYLTEVGILETAGFKEKSLALKEEALEKMREVVTKSEDCDEGAFTQMRAELTEKITRYLEQEEAKNLRSLSDAETLAVQTLKECITKLEMRMTTAVKNLDTREALLEEHKRATGETVEDFREKSGFKHGAILRRYSEQVRVEAEKMFQEIDEFFKMKKNGENAVLIGAIADAKQVYKDEMKRLTTSGPGHLSEAALEVANVNAQTVAMRSINSEGNLSSSQLEVAKDHLTNVFETFREKNALALQSSKENDVAIGIDLGTTYCCVAVYLHGRVQVLRNDVGTNTTPSYVYITPTGDCIFGHNAKKLAYKFPESTIFDAKRILGRAWDDKDLEKDRKYWPFTVEKVKGVPQIEVHGKYYRPEEISSMLLRHLKEGAEKQLDVKITKAVITVPAYFTDGQRQATVDAGELAGLKVLGILNEPSAAALEYRFHWFHDTEPRIVLVYDLGGGTFDVAVLKMGEKSIDVLSVNGDSHLGGEDFDQNMMIYCAAIFEKENGVDLSEDKDSENETRKKQARRRLRRLQTQCEEGKKHLMTAPLADVTVDAFLGEKDLDVEMSREEFEARNAARFQRTIEIVDSALKEAGVKREEIKDVILVGGSTRIPKIQTMLQEYLGGKALNERINPDEAVARGAAIQAAMLNCPAGVKLFDFGVIKEVTPMSLGVEMANSQFDVIIPKNTKFPVEHKEVYGTQQEDQTTVGIKIYQGEHKVAKENKLLGNFTLLGIKESVEVVMTIDSNGILKVEARCPSTGSCHGITVREDRGGISKRQKEKLLAATC